MITTYQRPACLARSLPQIIEAAHEVNAPTLIVDDGTREPWTFFNEEALFMQNAYVLRIPSNRGLAGALNIGLSFWLADPSVDVIHYFQDDVEVDPLAIAACNFVIENRPEYLVTAHDAREHHQKPHSQVVDAPYGVGLIKARTRPSCRATHVAMTRASWISLMPIPSRGLGLPGTKIMDGKRGTGSGVDWHMCRDSKNAKPVLCIPGLVRSFAHKAADSTWLNESIGGEEPPLHRDAIREWVEARR